MTISIHAPVKGATGKVPKPLAGQQDFNPRTREGCDVDTNSIFSLPLKISIHAPVKGATQVMRFSTTKYRISIHAPVKGATAGTDRRR